MKLVANTLEIYWETLALPSYSYPVAEGAMIYEDEFGVFADTPLNDDLDKVPHWGVVLTWEKHIEGTRCTYTIKDAQPSDEFNENYEPNWFTDEGDLY